MERNEEIAKIAEAFSRKAKVYDDFGEGHANLNRMRQKVRQQMLENLRPGDKILELNAGTGADAFFFASRGFQVHATDLAPGMVAQIEKKIDQHGVRGRFNVQQCSFLDLDQVVSGPFDYILSNMGGVNCTRDLGAITRNLPGLLYPGGYVTWVVMPPVCPFELAMVLRGNFKLAARRLSPAGTIANVEGMRFMTYYYTPAQVKRAFGPEFKLAGLKGLSVFTPTADQKDFHIHHPRLYRMLRFFDDRLSDLPPFNHWGDFFIATFQYVPDPIEHYHI